MKQAFFGCYRPTESELQELWHKCLFVLDANIVVGLHEVSEETREELLNTFRALSDRLWIPHHAGLEYQRKRFTKIIPNLVRRRRIYGDLRRVLTNTTTQFESKLAELNELDFVTRDRITSQLKAPFEKITKLLDDWERKHPDPKSDSDLDKAILTLFDGKVGPAYDQQRLTEIYTDGQLRYEAEIPPGYMDGGKGINKYGDLVLWYQIIDKAEKTKTPIIFITDEKKEDWWDKAEQEIVGPRHELVQEIRDKSGVMFHMYRQENFLRFANSYLMQAISESAIDEIETISEQQELEQAQRPLTVQEMLATSHWSASAAQQLEELNKAMIPPIDFQKRYPFMDLSSKLAKQLEELNKAMIPPIDFQKHFSEIIEGQLKFSGFTRSTEDVGNQNESCDEQEVDSSDNVDHSNAAEDKGHQEGNDTTEE